jgi:ribosome biogenesis protein ERB1
LRRLQANKVPDPEYDLYAPWVDFYTNTVMETPLLEHHRSKASFIPSKDEKRKVTELMIKIKKGLIKPKMAKSVEEDESKRFYMLWQTDDQVCRILLFIKKRLDMYFVNICNNKIVFWVLK